MKYKNKRTFSVRTTNGQLSEIFSDSWLFCTFGLHSFDQDMYQFKNSGC
ncbi:hypothetical protein Bsph_0491 [Lysinibacillus sphaericus C3-41]|uniref:Uncharacterized protein n=1 Tax=Lysinibacillus sphaericus (strain C3-41) TaxID=444177 RepID=B1HWF9_LYSSC|nr:hypothetical protein Bsph_0491 [Lysinibacillus sphaericus C3-41]